MEIGRSLDVWWIYKYSDFQKFFELGVVVAHTFNPQHSGSRDRPISGPEAGIVYRMSSRFEKPRLKNINNKTKTNPPPKKTKNQNETQETNQNQIWNRNF